MRMHFEMHAGFNLDDKVIIRICTRILCNLCSKTQISLFSCIISFHWPSWSIFAVLGHLFKLEMICINYLAMSVHLHYEVQWSYHSNYRDVCDSIFDLPSQGASVVVLAVFICGGFHFNILRISGNRVLMKSAILLSERVISDYNPVLSYSLTINTLQ